MIRKLLAALAVCSFTFVQADTFTVPKEESIASITFPEEWKVEAADDSLVAQSPDEDIYINIETHDAEDLAEAVAATIVTLKEHSVTFDQATEKKSETKFNGLDIINYNWKGKDEDGECKISLTVLSVTEKKVLLMLFWGNPAAEKKYEKDLGSILQSIKAVAK